MKTKAASAFFGGIHKPFDGYASAANNVTFIGGRSFPRLLQKFGKLFRRSAKETARCLICAAGHPDLHRLAQIVGKLPVGETVNLAKVRSGLDANFKTVVADLNYLIFELRLPIEFSRAGVLLKQPVQLCQSCTRNAARFCKSAAIDRDANVLFPAMVGGAWPELTAGRSGENPVSSPFNFK